MSRLGVRVNIEQLISQPAGVMNQQWSAGQVEQQCEQALSPPIRSAQMSATAFFIYRFRLSISANDATQRRIRDNEITWNNCLSFCSVQPKYKFVLTWHLRHTQD